MNDYSLYSALDFAQDDAFVLWVKYPAKYPENSEFWNSWLSNHPEKVDEVMEAKALILSLAEEPESLLGDRQSKVFERLQHSIDSAEKEDRKSSLQYYKIAASVLILVASISLIIYFGFNTALSGDKLQEMSIHREVNNGAQPRNLSLSDGTKVILQPKSVLEYNSFFEERVREVKLSGEAFFDVAKDPEKPFVVYTDNLLTKVLGTAFTIRAFENEKNFLVKVKRGKVSVFTDSDIESNKKKYNKQLQGILLTANQQVVYARKESKLTKSIVENPEPITNIQREEFEFKDAPLREVFSRLEQTYGIEIVYDEETMAGCALNASLQDIPLFDKMRLICKGVNAEFEILDSRIVVTGKGCKDWN